MSCHGSCTHDQSFNTRIPLCRLGAFSRWKVDVAPADSGQDYDFIGAYLAGALPDDDGHWDDRWKKPNHPTFSTDSIYAACRPELAGVWFGNVYIAPASRRPANAIANAVAASAALFFGVLLVIGGAVAVDSQPDRRSAYAHEHHCTFNIEGAMRCPTFEERHHD